MNLKMNILAVICFFGITITGCNDSDVKYGYNNDEKKTGTLLVMH